MLEEELVGLTVLAAVLEVVDVVGFVVAAVVVVPDFGTVLALVGFAAVLAVVGLANVD